MVIRMDVLFWDKVRRNPALRTALLPLLKIRREIAYRNYQNSDDAIYIRSLKNTFAGERCFIIGNGPSLKREDLELLKNEKTFACNRIYDMYPYTSWRPTFYMTVDSSILQKMGQEKKKNLGAEYLFFTNKKVVKKYKEDNAHQIFLYGQSPVFRERMVVNQISEDVSRYFSRTQSVTISALELAFYMGFGQIYLLGLDHNFGVEIDMKGRKKRNPDVSAHFAESKDKNIYPSNKEALTKCYETCNEYALNHGIRIVNVTRGGKLEVFERDELEEVLTNKSQSGYLQI